MPLLALDVAHTKLATHFVLNNNNESAHEKVFHGASLLRAACSGSIRRVMGGQGPDQRIKAEKKDAACERVTVRIAADSFS